MKKEMWIDIIFWCWIFLGTLMGVVTELKEECISIGILIEMVKENSIYAWSILGMVFLIFIFQFIQNGIITIGYIAYKVVIRKHKKERIEKVDIKNDEYYREIIPKYSAAVLSYIDDFNIEKNDIAATLLSLKIKKCIEIHENEIEIINENVELAENEKYVMECLKNNIEISMIEFKKYVKNDAFSSKLIEPKIDIGMKLGKSIGFSIGSFCLGMVLMFLTIANGKIIDNISGMFGIFMLFSYFLFIMACFFAIPAYIWIKFFMYVGVKTNDPYIRTKEGKEINKKIEGLRRYILDYSMMDNKNKEDLIIWEEYLVYSVILGINKKAAEDVLRMIKIQ